MTDHRILVFWSEIAWVAVHADRYWRSTGRTRPEDFR